MPCMPVIFSANELNCGVFQDEEEAGLLEQVKSQICDNVALYAQKYDEEFSPHLPGFVKAIWSLLVSTGQQVKYDLVSTSNILSERERVFFPCACKMFY